MKRGYLGAGAAAHRLPREFIPVSRVQYSVLSSAKLAYPINIIGHGFKLGMRHVVVVKLVIYKYSGYSVSRVVIQRSKAGRVCS